MKKNIVFYECKCSLIDCTLIDCNHDELINNGIKCKNCIKNICCCITIHTNNMRKKSLSLFSNLSLKSKRKLFLNTTKTLVSVALGIEILCIMAAEIGENIGLYWIIYIWL